VTLTSGQPELSEAFFNNLTILLTGMITQLTDLRELHEKRIRYSLRDIPNYSLPPQVKLPAVYVRLSDLVPSLAARKSTKKPWASDFVRITFKGVQKPATIRATTAGQQPVSDGGIGVVAEARLTVTDKSKFSLLKGNVDHDVSFVPQFGQFAMRLQAEAGKSIIDSLSIRLQAIARLVDFVDALRRSGRGIICESVTLRQVVFTYGDGTTTTASENVVSEQPRRWRVWLDLASGPEIEVKLEKGNPHLQVLDILKRMASSMGLELLPYWLTLTLPMLRGIEKLQDSWDKVALDDGSSGVEIYYYGLDHIGLRFRLPGDHQVKVHFKLRFRRGERWWHLSPHEPLGSESSTTKALKSVFDNHGQDWKGLGTGAAARPASGIEELLSALDTAMLNLASAPPATQSQKVSQPAAQQRPTLSHHGQGRNHSLVVID
jgi:mediator of RNA polymerase II transcription subunit 14